MDISANPSGQVAEAEMADIDQFRPATKSHVEPGSLETTEVVKEEMADDEDWDDIYGTDAQEAARANKSSAVEQQIGSAPAPPAASEPAATEPAVSGVKAVDEDVNMTAHEGQGTLPLAPPGENHKAEAQPAAAAQSADDPLLAKMTDAGDDDLVDESKTQINGIDEPSSRMIQETSEVEQPSGASPDSDKTLDHEVPTIQTHGDANSKSTEPQTDADADAEFAAAAKAQADNPEAEFGWDSSSEDSSSDSSSSDDDSSDDDVEPLDAETLGKILMAEDGGDGEGKASANPPKTQNEVDMIFPKPDITITPNMKITHLGKIEHFVGNIAVILGNTSAHDEVMEIESVLCNDQREVIGVIQDAMCKVDEPRYIVAFADAEEHEKLGLQIGSDVYYVDAHSKTVFTKGLRGKGTDASNIHDEEVGEDEMDFSDDEKEAEYKKKNKQSKKAGRGALSRGAFNRGEHMQYEQEDQQSGHGGRGGRGGRGGSGGRGRGRGGAEGYTYHRGAPGANAGTPYDRPQRDFPSVLNYDDDVKTEPVDDDGMYTPLKRPDNMAQMQQMGGPSGGGTALCSIDGGGRGRGGSRGRGEGGRGRGDKVAVTSRTTNNRVASSRRPQSTSLPAQLKFR
jgi:H/ACA ribonucleoprotein complex non-core subunit NAF1